MHALMTIGRSLMLAALVLVVPFVFRLAAMGSSMEQRVPWLTLLPPAWFVGLERLLLGTSDPWLTRLAGLRPRPSHISCDRRHGLHRPLQTLRTAAAARISLVRLGSVGGARPLRRLRAAPPAAAWQL
jgi:hypothetical protein